MQVSTIARGAWIVSGGYNGFARIFDRRTGQLIQRLEHEQCEPTIAREPCSSLNYVLARKQIPAVAVGPIALRA